MLIKRIRLTNLLSFGPDTEELELVQGKPGSGVTKAAKST